MVVSVKRYHWYSGNPNWELTLSCDSQCCLAVVSLRPKPAQRFEPEIPVMLEILQAPRDQVGRLIGPAIVIHREEVKLNAVFHSDYFTAKCWLPDHLVDRLNEFYFRIRLRDSE